MVLCSNNCDPCCDFCIYAEHEKIVYRGEECTGGPIGCNLHKDQEHQNIAFGCGFCDDFHCFLADMEETICF